MNDINYWERFLTTGSVNDFLSYKNVMRDMEQEKKESNIVDKDRSGEQSHAGLYRSYRDDFKV